MRERNHGSESPCMSDRWLITAKTAPVCQNGDSNHSHNWPSEGRLQLRSLRLSVCQMGDCNPGHEYPVCQMGGLITAKTATVSDGRLIMATTGPCMSDWTVIMATQRSLYLRGKTNHIQDRLDCNHSDFIYNLLCRTLLKNSLI